MKLFSLIILCTEARVNTLIAGPFISSMLLTSIEEFSQHVRGELWEWLVCSLRRFSLASGNARYLYLPLPDANEKPFSWKTKALFK